MIHHLGQRETARKYGVTHKMVQSWIRLYLEKGKDYLYTGVKNNQDIIKELPAIQTTQYSDPLTTRKPKGSKLDESSLPSEIRDELIVLRMENAYLKKLNALVRKNEKSPTRIKLK